MQSLAILPSPRTTAGNAERQAVEFGVEIGEYRGVVRVPRRVFQRLLPERPIGDASNAMPRLRGVRCVCPALPTLSPDRTCAADHPLGARCIKRRSAPLGSMLPLRTQRRDIDTSEL